MIEPAAATRMLRRPLPFEGGGGRHKVGARSVAEADWLEPLGADGAGQLAAKERLFSSSSDAVLRVLPGSGAACGELLALVRANLRSRGLPDEGLPSGAHPLELAGRLVSEDFCLHLPDPASGELILAAGCVCFPNRWRLADKIGRPVMAVHEPVPGYAPEVGTPVQRLMERLPVGRVLERHNWGLADGPELFMPAPRAGATLGRAEVAERLWLRIERQTLRRLPDSGAVVFTIRTLQAPIGILRGDPTAAGALAATIRALPSDLATYKLGSLGVRGAVLAWLAE